MNDPKKISVGALALPDPKRQLQEMERGVFESVLALSAAIDQGVIVAFTCGRNEEGDAICELICHKKPGSPEDEPNPSESFKSQSVIAAMAQAGETISRAMRLQSQKDGRYNDFFDKKDERNKLRKSVIALPGAN